MDIARGFLIGIIIDVNKLLDVSVIANYFI